MTRIALALCLMATGCASIEQQCANSPDYRFCVMQKQAAAQALLGVGLGMSTYQPARPSVTTCNFFSRSMTCVGD